MRLCWFAVNAYLVLNEMYKGSAGLVVLNIKVNVVIVNFVSVTNDGSCSIFMYVK